jgi:DNA-binding transcriptional MerR regulator
LIDVILSISEGSINKSVMEKYLYTIGELAEILGESTSCVRFWSDSFSKFVNPKRNAKGNRLFTKDDVETFKHIQLLLKVEGLTIEGAAKRLRGEKKDVINKSRVLESLEAIRQQLLEIREEL